MNNIAVPVAMVLHLGYVVSEEERAWFADPGQTRPAGGTVTRMRLRCGRFGEMATLDLRKMLSQMHVKHCPDCRRWKEWNDEKNPDSANI